MRQFPEVANRDYAMASEASAEEYTALMQALDGEREQRRMLRGVDANNEAIDESSCDREVGAPFELPPEPPVEPRKGRWPPKGGPPRHFGD